MQKIMFNDKYGLTKAVLEGRKTMTRRTVPEKLLEAYYDYDDYCLAVAPSGIPYSRDYEKSFFLPRSRYKVGEVVAVAQAYKDTCLWSNKMFVYAGLMPHQIRITNVRMERLQDISDEDCLQEGVWKDEAGGRVIGYPFGVPFFYTFDGAVNKKTGKQLHWTTPREAFAALIDRVSGKGTWELNPWVYVYEFELVK